MESAFGIQHGFSKSLVGGSWKKASQLTRAERKYVGGYRDLRGRSTFDDEFAANDKLSRGMIEQVKRVKEDPRIAGIDPAKVKTHKTKQGKVTSAGLGMFNNPLPPGVSGVTVKVGGRGKKGERAILYRKDKSPLTPDMKPKKTLKHELAHASSNGGAYRQWQLLHDPKKLMREEARADAAVGHFADSKRGPSSAYAAAVRSSARKESRNEGLDALQRSEGGSYGQVTRKDLDDYQRIHDNIHGRKRVPGSSLPEIIGRKMGNAVIYHPEAVVGGVTAAAFGPMVAKETKYRNEGIMARSRREKAEKARKNQKRVMAARRRSRDGHGAFR